MAHQQQTMSGLGESWRPLGPYLYARATYGWPVARPRAAQERAFERIADGTYRQKPRA